MIEVKNLTKRYGNVRAVNDISFTVGDVGVYGFLGPNGAGKSTTMNVITGCLAASSGEVKIEGHDIFEESAEAKKYIGYLPENPPLYPDMTPLEYLRFVASAKGVPAGRVEAEVNSAMKKTSIEHMADRLIKNLSKGYKQRVGIAQALIGGPKIIILDEPTVGLDPLQIIEIRDLIRSLGKEHTVILSSHILPEISEVCEYVIVIAHGKIVASDTLVNLNRSFSETEILRIETRGNGDKLRTELEKIEGADKVTVSGSAAQVKAEIEVAKGADIRESVSNLLRDLDMPVLGLASSAQSLEDIFIKLVNEQYESEPDPAQPKKKEKKQKDVAPSPKGRAYYGAHAKDSDDDDDAAAADASDDSEYTPLFAETDDDDAPSGEDDRKE